LISFWGIGGELSNVIFLNSLYSQAINIFICSGIYKRFVIEVPSEVNK
jgi:hypothetical protein